MLYQTTLFQKIVSFKRITAVARFANLMLEEADVRKCVLDTNDRTRQSILIKK